MQDKIDQDLKSALLAGDKAKVETLRVLKSAILNETIAQNARDSGLDDEQITRVLSRESKKRAEAAELYQKAGEVERANKELAEKAIIEGYLPEQLSEADVAKAVDEEVGKYGNATMADMGKIIGAVRGKLGAAADGGLIARLVKERLQ